MRDLGEAEIRMSERFGGTEDGLNSAALGRPRPKEGEEGRRGGGEGAGDVNKRPCDLQVKAKKYQHPSQASENPFYFFL